MHGLGRIALTIIVFGMLPGCAANNPNSSLFDQNTIGGVATASIDQGDASTAGNTNTFPGLPKGYQCPFVPNGFDPVASIFRVDKSGTFFRVADLSNDKRVLANVKNNVKIGNYAFSDSQKASADLSVSLLKRILPGLSGNARTKKDFDVGITVKNIHAKVLYDAEADYIRDWFAKKVRPKPRNRYFLVREAIFAGSVNYTMNAKDIQAAGLKANVEEVVDVTANATFTDRGRRLVIEQSFDPPTQVCIKVSEIEIRRPRTRGIATTATLKPASRSAFPKSGASQSSSTVQSTRRLDCAVLLLRTDVERTEII